MGGDKSLGYKRLILNLWGLGKLEKAALVCKDAWKHAKKAGLQSHQQELRKWEKKIRKKQQYPFEKVKEAKLNRKEYRKVRNFSHFRECAECGKRDGTLLQCSACEQAWYCSAAHQKKHW